MDASPGRQPSGAAERALLVVLLAALLAPALARPLARGADDLELTIPYALAERDALRRHEACWWLPWLEGGTSTFARFPYLGPFYPAVALFWALEPALAWRVAVLVHLVIGALGARALARELGASRAGAWIAGAAFGGSSFFSVAVVEGYATQLPTWCWLPWLLTALERAADGRRAALGGAGLAAGLIALGGHATEMYVACMLTVPYVVARLAAAGSARRRRYAAATVTAAALGLAIGAAFWWPALAILADGALGAERAAKPGFALPWARLLLGWHAWGTKASLFVPIVGLALAPAALAPRQRRAAALAVLVPAGVAAGLFAGPGHAPWRLAQALVPGFSLLDQAVVLSAPFALFVSVAAGLGLERPARPVAALAAVAWLGAALVVAVENPPLALGILPAAAAAATAAGTLAVASDRAVAAVVALELAVHALGVVRLPPAEPPTAGAARTAAVAAALTRNRTVPPAGLLPLEVDLPEARVAFWRNEALAHRVVDVRASTHLTADRYRAVLAELAPWPVSWERYSDERARVPAGPLVVDARRERILDLLDVTHVLTDRPLAGAGFRPVAQVAGATLLARPRPYARDRLVTRAVAAGDELSAVLSADVDLATDVVLPRRTAAGGARAGRAARDRPAPDRPGAAADTPAGTVRVRSWAPGRLTLDVVAERQAWLVAGERDLPGWTATVDGERRPLARANVLHLALRVEPGPHEVRLVYRPPGLAGGGALSALGILACAWLVATGRASGLRGGRVSADEYYEAFGGWRAWSHRQRVARLAPLCTGRVLDVGCGDGRTFLDTLGARAVGLDRSPEMLASGRARTPRAHLVRGDAGALPLADGTFDTVLVSHALWLFAEPEAFLREAARVLVPGGRIVVVSNHPHYFALRALLLAARALVGRPHGEEPPRLYRARAIAAALRRAGFDELATESFLVVPVPGFGWLDRTPLARAGLSFATTARRVR